ncbi:TetR/AcrR family transcriptional regulator [Thermomonospora umbrina]|uniref:TetR family transcriptional regulator n=1 Tax=Thermomonospora umbrina TaxID=111806 RepID=A0A3D9SU12_9ACTN|nr:TetR/AcrR family transcriptional regulator [Thermomonospora umbrina]REE99268.1 TetR family transcriptional regulator [Thermomonospora umbrina]
MPRVSEEHLERRRRQVLDAARVCFARRGFHETSMQDIFAESGMSAGAVYRYFKSKGDLVEAIAADTIIRVAASMASIVAENPLPELDEVVGRICDLLVAQYSVDDADALRLAPQAWALALYDPEVGVIVLDAMTRIRQVWLTYAERLRDVGRLPADADLTAVSKALFGLLPGFILQRVLLKDVDPAVMRLGVRTLMTSLSVPLT